jgi:hypothetical protein
MDRWPDGRILAHAFGERYDSPVPLALFVLGGAVVVLLSFLLVVRQEVTVDEGAPAQEELVTPGGGALTGGLAVLVLAGLVAAGLVGSQQVAENIAPTMLWLVVWVAVPLLVGVVGDFTGPVNPFAAIARAMDRPRLRRAVLGRGRAVRWPARLGYWPAVVVFFVAVVGELVVNEVATLPRVIAVALLVYAVLCALGGLVAGAQAFTGKGEFFTVLFSTWGRLGWFRFRAPGRRGFAGGLDAPFEASASRVVFVLFLLVSVTFDGLLSTPQWGSFTGSLPWDVVPGSRANTVVAISALLLLTGLMLSVFGAFAVVVGRVGGHGVTGLASLTGLLPSLLPIAFGYLLAHYLQYVLINGQLILPLIGNPVGSPSWPLALPYPFNDTYEVNTAVMPTSVVWYFQIAVIVLAHIVAVVLAHRHLAVRATEPVLARRSEWPWLVAMVGYTMVSLWLLAQPLVEHGGGHGGGEAAGSAVRHLLALAAG